MTVKAAFVIGAAERLLVPLSALVRRSEIAGVYVLGEHGPQLRQVRLGHRYGERVEVLAGLSAGERIALDPNAARLALAALPDPLDACATAFLRPTRRGCSGTPPTPGPALAGRPSGFGCGGGG